MSVQWYDTDEEASASQAPQRQRAAELARLEARYGRARLQAADARMVRACDAGIAAAAEEARERLQEEAYGDDA